MSKENKFHGMTVVTDYDQTTVKGQSVIEMNSNNELVCRNYDQDGNADDDAVVLNVMEFCASKYPKKPTESNITGFIKREVHQNSLLISEGAIKTIQKYLQ